MTDFLKDSAARLTAAALDLAVSLDSFTTLDWAEQIGPAVRQGHQKLAGLQRQRDTLIVSQTDGVIIEWLLETISARLNFLERLDAALGQCGSKEKPQTRHLCQSPGEQCRPASDWQSRSVKSREPHDLAPESCLGGDQAA